MAHCWGISLFDDLVMGLVGGCHGKQGHTNESLHSAELCC